MAQKTPNSITSDKSEHKDIIKQKKKGNYESGVYRKKCAADFLFFPWPANKKFFDRLAEDYLQWALTLSEKISSGQFDPNVKCHSLTPGEFLQESGIPDQTFRTWLKKDDALLLNEVHQTVKNILGRIRENLALFDKANANHIRATLGFYSQEYKEEREWLSKIANNNDDSLKSVTLEIPCYKEHKNESRDENKA